MRVVGHAGATATTARPAAVGGRRRLAVTVVKCLIIRPTALPLSSQGIRRAERRRSPNGLSPLPSGPPAFRSRSKRIGIPSTTIDGIWP
jgi:hypothetical protein